MDYDNRIRLLVSICLMVPVAVACLHLAWCTIGDRRDATPMRVRDPLA